MPCSVVKIWRSPRVQHHLVSLAVVGTCITNLLGLVSCNVPPGSMCMHVHVHVLDMYVPACTFLVQLANGRADAPIKQRIPSLDQAPTVRLTASASSASL